MTWKRRCKILSINTKEGKQSLQYEEETLLIIKNRVLELIDSGLIDRSIDFVKTDKATPSAIDGFIVENEVVKSFFECKTKTNKTAMDLKNSGGWLINFQKIERAKTLSFWLQVPFFLFGYLPLENKVFAWQITDSRGNFTFEFETKEVNLPETLNKKTEWTLQKVVLLPMDKVKTVFFDTRIKV